ncbi:Universal stress protein F [Roseibium album]|nr:Universal stress protein F [Roseibium album]
MYKNILVPIIFDELHDTQASYLVARSLADDDAKFTVLHVIEEMPTFVSSQLPSELLASSRQEAEKALKQSAAALPEATTCLASGHAGRFIIDYADENGIDCIVLASHRPGMEDFFLGSTAGRVVRHAKCAVHVIR